MRMQEITFDIGYQECAKKNSELVDTYLEQTFTTQLVLQQIYKQH